MIINDKGQMIGRGEKTVKKILEILFPNAYVGDQVKLSTLVPVSKYWRQEKESADLALWRTMSPETGKPDFVVRVQNEKGSIRMNHESRQKAELEEKQIQVVDILWYECTETFKERINYLSFFEVCDALRRADIKP